MPPGPFLGAVNPGGATPGMNKAGRPDTLFASRSAPARRVRPTGDTDVRSASQPSIPRPRPPHRLPSSRSRGVRRVRAGSGRRSRGPHRGDGSPIRLRPVTRPRDQLPNPLAELDQRRDQTARRLRQRRIRVEHAKQPHPLRSQFRLENLERDRCRCRRHRLGRDPRRRTSGWSTVRPERQRQDLHHFRSLHLRA